MKKVILILLIFLLSVGCSTKKEKQKEYELTEIDTGIIVITSDNNVSDDTKVSVEVKENDYTNLSDNINKSVGYDISLINDEDKVNIKTSSEVYLKIPDDFDTTKLIVYYVLNDKIEDTFDVEIVEKNKEKYAKFETNHFSIYVLAELKEIEKVETEKDELKENKKEENNNEKETTKKENNESTNKNNSSSSLSTINLVGNWKNADSETYYTFRSDYTGTLYINATEETVQKNFVWGFQDGKLSIRYEDAGMGSISGKIKIYNDNKIDIQPSKGLIYNRYYGEIAITKIQEKTLKFNVKYINIPEGLEVSDTNSKQETVTVRTNNASLLNNTYDIIFDLSNCSLNSCTAKPSFNLPKGIEVISAVISKSVNLRNKRYYRDVYFDILYVNFSDGYYNATASKNVFKANVYAESEEELDNATYEVLIDMKENNKPGTWNVLAEYSASGNVNLTKEGLSEYVTVTVTEKTE